MYLMHKLLVQIYIYVFREIIIQVFFNYGKDLSNLLFYELFSFFSLIKKII